MSLTDIKLSSLNIVTCPHTYLFLRSPTNTEHMSNGSFVFPLLIWKSPFDINDVNCLFCVYVLQISQLILPWIFFHPVYGI